MTYPFRHEIEVQRKRKESESEFEMLKKKILELGQTTIYEDDYDEINDFVQISTKRFSLDNSMSEEENDENEEKERIQNPQFGN